MAGDAESAVDLATVERLVARGDEIYETLGKAQQDLSRSLLNGSPLAQPPASTQGMRALLAQIAVNQRYLAEAASLIRLKISSSQLPEGSAVDLGSARVKALSEGPGGVRPEVVDASALGRCGWSSAVELEQSALNGAVGVDTVARNLVYTTTDLDFPGRAAILAPVRTWNSRASRRRGLFGPGWSCLLDANITVLDEESLVFVSSDGCQQRYVLVDQGAGRFHPDQPDGAGHPNRASSWIEAAEPAQGWRLKRPNGSVWTFGSDGRLVGGLSPRANLEISWDRTSVRVTETVSQRWVDYRVEDARVVELVDGDGRQCVYRYDHNGYLVLADRPAGRVSLVVQAGLIVSVVGPVGDVWVAGRYDEMGRVNQLSVGGSDVSLDAFARTLRPPFGSADRPRSDRDTDSTPSDRFEDDDGVGVDLVWNDDGNLTFIGEVGSDDESDPGIGLTIGYHPGGTIKTVDKTADGDPEQRLLSVSVDQAGRPVRLESPAGTETIQRGGDGLPESGVCADGSKWSVEHDHLGRPVAVARRWSPVLATTVELVYDEDDYLTDLSVQTTGRSPIRRRWTRPDEAGREAWSFESPAVTIELVRRRDRVGAGEAVTAYGPWGTAVWRVVDDGTSLVAEGPYESVLPFAVGVESEDQGTFAVQTGARGNNPTAAADLIAYVDDDGLASQIEAGPGLAGIGPGDPSSNGNGTDSSKGVGPLLDVFRSAAGRPVRVINHFGPDAPRETQWSYGRDGTRYVVDGEGVHPEGSPSERPDSPPRPAFSVIEPWLASIDSRLVDPYGVARIPGPDGQPMAAVSDDGAITWLRDGSGRILVATTDIRAEGVTRSYERDRLGRVVSSTVSCRWREVESSIQRSFERPDLELGIAYDPNGHVDRYRFYDGTELEAVFHGGQLVHHELRGNRVALPDLRSIRRDDKGRLLVDDRGRLYSYDENGRLEEIFGLDGQRRTFVETDGQLRSVAVGPLTTSFTYDRDGRIIRVDDALRGSLTVTTDARGRRISEQWANGASTFYQWDGFGRIAGITSTEFDGRRWQLSVISDDQGRPCLAVIDAGGGPLATSIRWSPDGQVVGIGHTNIAHLRYAEMDWILTVKAGSASAFPVWRSTLADDPWGSTKGASVALGVGGSVSLGRYLFIEATLGGGLYDTVTRSFLAPVSGHRDGSRPPKPAPADPDLRAYGWAWQRWQDADRLLARREDGGIGSGRPTADLETLGDPSRVLRELLIGEWPNVSNVGRLARWETGSLERL